jgi:hypothetical protein
MKYRYEIHYETHNINYVKEIDIKNKIYNTWYIMELNRSYHDMKNPVYKSESYKRTCEWVFKNHPEYLL